MRTRLSHDLTLAMKARDLTAVAALRSTCAAIENAQAVAVAQPSQTSSEHVAGAALGVASADVRRRTLSDAEVASVVSREIEERLSAAEQLDTHGQHEHAERLRAEATVIERYLA